MYLIANRTKRQIFIADIGISIRPKQALNLHKMKLKIPVAQSRDLKICRKKGLIKILKQDRVSVAIPQETVVQQVPQINEETLLQSMRQMLSEEIDKKIGEFNPELGSNEEVLVLLKQIAASRANVQAISQQENDEEGIEMAEDILVDIHQRSLKKQIHDVDGVVKYEGQEIFDTSFLDNIAELGDLSEKSDNNT